MNGLSPRGAVLLVRDVLSPGHRAAGLIDLLHRDMCHEAVRCRSVPVILIGFEVDGVSGKDLFDRSAAALAKPQPLGDVNCLA
jgi:hypothetical protein